MPVPTLSTVASPEPQNRFVQGHVNPSVLGGIIGIGRDIFDRFRRRRRRRRGGATEAATTPPPDNTGFGGGGGGGGYGPPSNTGPVPGGPGGGPIAANDNNFNIGIGFGGGSGVGAIGALGLAGGGSRGRRELIELLLASGQLNGILAAPIVYTNAETGGQLYRANKGWVVVRWRQGGQRMIAQCPRSIARTLGLWKPAKKPVISVKDSNAIRRAERAKNRVEKLGKAAGLYVRKSAPRAAPKPRRATRRRT